MSPRRSRRRRSRLARLRNTLLPALSLFIFVIAAVLLVGFNTLRSNDQANTPHPNNAANDRPIKSKDSGHRNISAFSDQFIIRSSGGSCNFASTVEVSGDGGATWHPVNIAQTTGATQVLSIDAVRPGFAEIIAYDRSECEPIALQSFSGGVSWERGILYEQSFFDIESPNYINVGEEVIEISCTASDVADSEMLIAVLCTDDSLLISDDLGESWEQRPAMTSAAALDVLDSEIYVIQAETVQCEGIIVSVINDDETTEHGDCFLVDERFNSNSIAASATDESLYVWVGSSMAISDDQGQTWRTE